MEDPREHDELSRLAPTLANLKRQDPFVVPDGFFDRFPHEVQAAIVARERRKGWAAWPVLVRRMAVALPVIALLAGAWWFLRPENMRPIASLSTTPSLEELSWTDEQDLLASLDEEHLSSISFTDVELTEAELAAYVEHENIDLAELLIEQ